MNNNGWIKLFYRFCDWEWYGDANMVALFVHLLLRANYKPVRRRGVEFGRGIVVTSREELSLETGLSQRVIRTCLARLKSTNEIDIKATSHGSVITICNYDKYQGDGVQSDQQSVKQDVQQSTNKRPAIDQQSTSSKEYIEYKEVEEIKKEKNIFSSLRSENIQKKRGVENFSGKKKAVVAEPARLTYAECVTMTPDEHDALVNSYGAEATQWMIEKLDNYKAATGKKYKNDYRAILSWVADEYTKTKNYATTSLPYKSRQQLEKEQRDREFAAYIAAQLNADHTTSEADISKLVW